MHTAYKILLLPGKTVSRDLFPEGAVISLEKIGAHMLRLIVKGNETEVERILRGLKECVRFYERV